VKSIGPSISTLRQKVWVDSLPCHPQQIRNGRGPRRENRVQLACSVQVLPVRETPKRLLLG